MNSKLIVSSLFVCALVACGDSGTGSGGSGGSSTNATTGSKMSTTGSKMATSAATGATGGAGADGTSGLPCTTDAMCDTSGDGTSACSIDKLYMDGSFFPDAVCLQTAQCDLGDGTTVTYCDGDTGTCLDANGTGVCLPYCQFDDTGAATTGNCPGKDACNPYGFGKDMNMASFGVGYCFGGCLADGDCKLAGEACDVGTGLCTDATKIVTPTKMAGEACTGTADTSCNCGIGQTATGGMCVQFCKVGDAANTCPTGTVCDAGLPATGTVPFTKEPAGMAGACTKTCTADTDCPTLPAGFCYASAGHTEKTCHFGAAQ